MALHLVLWGHCCCRYLGHGVKVGGSLLGGYGDQLVVKGDTLAALTGCWVIKCAFMDVKWLTLLDTEKLDKIYDIHTVITSKHLFSLCHKLCSLREVQFVPECALAQGVTI